MNRSRIGALAAFAMLLPSYCCGVAHAAEVPVTSIQRPELKAVFGQVESHDVVPARARIGGTVTSLSVEAGTAVKAGDIIAFVVDDKLALQLGAVDARIKAIQAQLDNAKIELERGSKLLEGGIVSKTRVDLLQTQFDVLASQLTAAEADRAVLLQQQSEGAVIAPAPGRVLTVPVTKGSVIMPGETIARIAGGGYFLRLSLPERHAGHIKLGDDVIVGSRGMTDLSKDAPLGHGKVVKVYPEISNGNVLADVEVADLGDFFVGERTRVWIPVAMRRVVSAPASAISTRAGVDYVKLSDGTDVPVIIGQRFDGNGGPSVEILSGLGEGDKVLTP
ncbi:efflux RND transporter periplasmic adaptor subunit [Aestuariivirga sp.]|uniref:efflux RND transporter periplasmic adaptor subunit n=1 Tax=Aestuariivirga sp. TaxID=2650926 RepID=UPI003BAC24C2